MCYCVRYISSWRLSQLVPRMTLVAGHLVSWQWLDTQPLISGTVKKEICRIFKENNLRVTIEANLQIVDFLDITLDLKSGSHKPFMKPNNTPLYVHNNSNHPPTIKKNIPENINKRLSSISSNQAVFNEAAAPYQDALDKSGYKYKLNYQPPQPPPHNTQKSRRRSRKRKVTWFNPPYSDNVKTNIGKQFLKLVDKCFPPDHPLHGRINRNTVKISYRTMPNMKQIIAAHNKSLMKKDAHSATPGCNCRKNTKCPLDGQCQISGVVYQATVTRQDDQQ